MFPKAHAVAYCIMSFRIAYFKVHHPLAFYADYFTNKASGFDAIVACGGLGRTKDRLKLIRSMEKPTAKELDEASVLDVVEEVYARGFHFLPVDIYKSDNALFLIEEDKDEKKLRPPLIGLPGLGENAAKAMKREILMTRIKLPQAAIHRQSWRDYSPMKCSTTRRECG